MVGLCCFGLFVLVVLGSLFAHGVCSGSVVRGRVVGRCGRLFSWWVLPGTGIAQWGTARLCLTNAQGAVRGSPGGAESVLGCGCDGAGPVMMHGDDLAGHLLGPVASAPFSVLFFSG